jgi:8-oxo-dGTP diphosphatase
MKEIKEKPKVKVAGCFLEYDGKFLILLRRDNQHQGGRWGLPAGKVELGETEKEAIIREVREETGFLIPSENLEFLQEVLVDYAARVIDFFVYRIMLESKINVVLEPQVHCDCAWVSGEEYYGRNDLIKGAREILEKTGYAPKNKNI